MKQPKIETQRAKVRDYLLTGKTITSWEAIQMFHCTRLSAVIYSLINDYDMDIETQIIWEEDTHYAKYFLKKEES